MRTDVTSRVVRLLAAGAIVAAGVSASACRAPAAPVDVDAASIGGVVLNGGRPEAGVWVIAETTGLPTHFSRIVVTDDDGRFLVPDLPESASYDVWVRGYGLRDSQPVKAARGERVSLQVENAQTPQEAARIYPANYWLSLYQPPPSNALPLADSEGAAAPVSHAGERDEETGEAARRYPGREHWVGQMKLGCMLCHQMGQEMTRLFDRPEHWDAVWERAGMLSTAEGLGKRILRESLADWGTRIAGGEVPPAPPRPSRHRAQHGHQPVGVGPGRQLHPRQRLHRQAQPDAVSQRQGVGHRYRPELPVGAGSEDARDDRARGAAARRTGARPRAVGPDSGEHELAQPDARRQGQRLAHDRRARLPGHTEMGGRRDRRRRRGDNDPGRAGTAIQPSARLLR